MEPRIKDRMRAIFRPGWRGIFSLFALLLLSACGQELPELDWRQHLLVPTVVIELADGEGRQVPATWTPAPSLLNEPISLTYATFTPRPTQTAAFFPTRTPRPSATFTPSVTPIATAIPAPTAFPTPPLPAPGAPNLLPNASFEGGWYNAGNVPELQIPNQWAFEYDEGPNFLDPDPWNAWYRPEARILGRENFPAHEQGQFIWDGNKTLKIFKGFGAISFRFFTDVNLQPGTYMFTTYIFPDLVNDYLSDGTKVWAPDPLSGEVRFIIGETATGWVLPTFGQRNTMTYVFTVDTVQTMRIGMAFRGRWAIISNGWFMDNWSLVRVN